MINNYTQASMLDISEKLGREACMELQSEYSKDSVMFTHCDVANREQLVSLMASSRSWK